MRKSEGNWTISSIKSEQNSTLTSCIVCCLSVNLWPGSALTFFGFGSKLSNNLFRFSSSISQFSMGQEAWLSNNRQIWFSSGFYLHTPCLQFVNARVKKIRSCISIHTRHYTTVSTDLLPLSRTSNSTLSHNYLAVFDLASSRSFLFRQILIVF